MYRFAVLPYCNSAPLVHFITEIYPQILQTYCSPKDMLFKLKSGQVDAALLPVYDFLTESGLELVPGIGICANGSVESVLLKCRCPLKSIRSVRLSAESRTSNILVQLLLRQCSLAFTEISFSYDVEDTDAYVVIGDKALCSKPSLYRYDLSELWQQQMSLPFVFAVWAYSSDSTRGEEIISILHRAKEEGCRSIQKLSGIHAQRLRLDPSYIYHYLTDCLYYDIGPLEIQSMKRFGELLMELTPTKPKLETTGSHLD